LTDRRAACLGGAADDLRSFPQPSDPGEQNACAPIRTMASKSERFEYRGASGAELKVERCSRVILDHAKPALV
jgi:hypothetical protein